MHHVASSPLPTRACPRYTCILLVLAFIVKANLLVRVYRNTEDTLVGRGTWTPAPAGIKVSLVHFATLLTWRLDHGLVPPSVERRYGRVRRLRALLVDTGVAIVLSLLAVGQLQLVEGGVIKSMRMGSTAIAAGTCVLEFSVVRVLGALSTLFLPCGVVVLWCRGVCTLRLWYVLCCVGTCIVRRAVPHKGNSPRLSGCQALLQYWLRVWASCSSSTARDLHRCVWDATEPAVRTCMSYVCCGLLCAG